MIVPMKKLYLAGREKDRTTLLQHLRELGVVHVEPVDPARIHAPDDLQEKIRHAVSALQILEEFHPEEQTMGAPGTPSRLVGEVLKQQQTLRSTEARLNAARSRQAAVRPWGRINPDDLDALRRAGLSIGFLVCAESEVDDLLAAVDVGDCVAVFEGVAYVIVAGRGPFPAAVADKQVEAPEIDWETLAEEIADLEEKRRECRGHLLAVAKRRDEIEAYHRELLQKKRFAEVEQSVHAEESLFVLQGWVPEAELPALEEHLPQKGLPVCIQAANPTPEEQPPTRMNHPWYIQPIESLYSFMGIVPGYREANIGPVFLLAMILFPAMLIADAGYGLVALLALGLGYKPLLAMGIEKKTLNLFFFLFVGLSLYGVLTNTYFGETKTWVSGFDSNSTEGIAFLQWVCFTIGAVHLSLAHLWKAWRKPRTVELLSDLGWVLFIWAMYALVCVLVLQQAAPFWMVPLFVVSLVLILLFTAPSWNIPMAIAQGLGAVALNASAFLSDIISYIRLWAVGFSGGVLAHSFNELAWPLPWYVAIVALTVGHLMNFSLGLIAILAHGVRLNLLEFSNHLELGWTGRAYDPFKKQ